MNANRMKLGSAFAVSLVLFGCTTPTTEINGGAGSKSSRVKAAVVVVPSEAKGPFNYVTPMEKKEALEQGLRDGLLVAAEPGGVFVLPLTMTIGAAQGVRGKTTEEISRAEMALTNAAAELDPCKQLCEQLVEIGRMTGHTWLLAKVV